MPVKCRGVSSGKQTATGGNVRNIVLWWSSLRVDIYTCQTVRCGTIAAEGGIVRRTEPAISTWRSTSLIASASSQPRWQFDPTLMDVASAENFDVGDAKIWCLQHRRKYTPVDGRALWKHDRTPARGGVVGPLHLTPQDNGATSIGATCGWWRTRNVPQRIMLTWVGTFFLNDDVFIYLFIITASQTYSNINSKIHSYTKIKKHKKHRNDMIKSMWLWFTFIS